MVSRRVYASTNRHAEKEENQEAALLSNEPRLVSYSGKQRTLRSSPFMQHPNSMNRRVRPRTDLKLLGWRERKKQVIVVSRCRAKALATMLCFCITRRPFRERTNQSCKDKRSLMMNQCPLPSVLRPTRQCFEAYQTVL